MLIRDEEGHEAGAIAELVTAAFATAPHSDGNEARILEGLRAAGALTLGLVAVEDTCGAPARDGPVAGHVAFSPVAIDGVDGGWFALGPIAVAPRLQRRGIGAALVREGLDRLRASGARGIVLVGDRAYYGRFGFRHRPGLTVEGVPPAFVLARALSGEIPAGAVRHHPAFFPEADRPRTMRPA